MGCAAVRALLLLLLLATQHSTGASTTLGDAPGAVAWPPRATPVMGWNAVSQPTASMPASSQLARIATCHGH
jgi:hypothetical protein